MAWYDDTDMALADSIDGSSEKSGGGFGNVLSTILGYAAPIAQAVGSFTNRGNQNQQPQVIQMPAPQPVQPAAAGKDKTLIYVGIGAGALVLVLGLFFALRK